MSSPADVYEQEADRIADQVMTDQPEPHRAPVQTRQVDAPGSAREASAPPLVRDVLHSEGRPLDPATRGLMRSRMGEDFATVRIHTGQEASGLAHRINARAFTVGRHIGFAAGQYAPETPQGQKLLAHELTHVLQQGVGRQTATSRSVAPAVLRRKIGNQTIGNQQSDSLPDVRASGRSATTTAAAMGSLAAALPAGTTRLGDPRSRAGETNPGTSRATGATAEETAGAPIGATRLRPKTSSARQGPPSKPGTRPGATSPKPPDAATRPTTSPRRRAETRHGKAGAGSGAPSTIDGNTDFQAAATQVRSDATRQKAHPLASRKRTEVEKAAVMEESEQNDQSAKERNTKKMAEVGAKQATAGKQFSAAEFKADLKKRVEAKPPRSEDEARNLAKSDAVAHFEDDFSSKLAKEQGKVTDPLTEQAKDPAAAGFDAPVNAIPIPKPAQSPSPTRVNPTLVVPKRQPDRDVALQRENDRLSGAMQNNRLDDDQLAESREPSFIKTLTAKNDAEHQIVEARAAYHRQESSLLQGATAQAGHTLSTELAGMSRTHARTGGLVHGGQKSTETQTQKRQREIKKTIDGIYTGTVDAVTVILGSMATKVKEDFANSLKTQTDDFNRSVRSRLDSYYSTGKKIKHFFLGEPRIVVSPDGSSTRDLTLDDYEPGFPPRIKSTVKWINPEVYDIFLEEKKRFLAAMDQQLDVIAANVQIGLTAATNRIELGRFFVAIYKASLKGEERTFADQLEQDVLMKFQTLEGTIDDAREDLLQTLADQYRDNVNQLETTFTDINDELKKSWLDKAVEFIETVGKTVFQLADLLFSILTRVAYLVWDIVKHPIRFFETLVSGLMQGVGEFISHIGTYLQEAFWTWLTDVGPGKSVRLSLGSGLAGLFDLVVQVLSLGPADLRAIVDKVLGPEFMQMVDKGTALAEKALEPVMILVKQGPVAFWHYLEGTLSNIIQSSFDRIKESVFYAFVEKGLKWIAGFFIPGGGFVKVVTAIVKAFQFVAANLDKIRMFFDSVFDSMEAATEGRTEGVASKIVNGLKTGVVLALDFLARQLGLDTIIGSVHKIIHALRRPIVSAIEWVLRKVKPFVTKIMRTLGLGKEERPHKDGAQGTHSAYDGQIGKVVPFSAAGESHKLWVAQHRGHPVVMMSSVEKPVSEQLTEYEQMANAVADEYAQQTARRYIKLARYKLGQIDKEADALAGHIADPKHASQQIQREDQAVADDEAGLAAYLVKIREALGIAAPSGASAEEATDVRERAAGALASELRTDHTGPETLAVVHGVKERLRPQGLRNLEVVLGGTENDAVVYAEATGRTPVASLKKQPKTNDATPSGRTVTAAFHLTLAESMVIPAGTLAPAGGLPRVPTGGQVLPPSKGAAQVIKTWNTSNIEETGNLSHAERQFVNWIDGEGKQYVPFIQKLDVRLFSLIPCSQCSEQLATVLTRITKTQDQLGKRKIEGAHLSWSRFYWRPELRPSWENINRLTRSGWTLEAPLDAYPPRERDSDDGQALKIIKSNVWRLEGRSLAHPGPAPPTRRRRPGGPKSGS
ncbi:MAG: DUF4157 domain-containing protein [Acidobacteriota bacterium]